MTVPQHYLPEGLAIPVPEPDGLSRPYWEGLRENRLLVQRCRNCKTWQWGPEWICHACHSFDMGWAEIEAAGTIHAWTRAWHPSHAVLKDRTPYILVIVTLPHAGDIRMVGNLLGDPRQEVRLGAAVKGVFEHHPAAKPAYSLLQWTC